MLNDTVLRLCEVPNIVGIKDATGNLDRGRELLSRCPSDFAVYSGDDATAAELMLAGARGNISVTANVDPARMAVKWALLEMGLIGPGIRLPLTPLSPPCQAPVRKALLDLGLLATCEA